MNTLSILRCRAREALRFVALACVLGVAAMAQVVGSAGLTGTVKDPTGAIISGATVQLMDSHGKAAASVMTDSAGRFVLRQPGSGDYQLTVTLSGFSPVMRRVHLAAVTPGAPALPPLAITMALASVDTSVTVTADQDMAVEAPENNQDAATVSADDMKNLPIFDADIVATMSAFLDANVSGEGGPTLVIDGVESKNSYVSPSAIERVSINQDPYSAQYRQPGRGQVEIITKTATESFHGSVSFTFRDAALNASNHFATSKPAEQRRIYEGYLTGPVKLFANTAFLLSLTRKEEDNYNQVDAVSLPGLVLPAQNVSAPHRSTALTMKISHQYNDHHSGYVLYRFFDSSNANSNVSGQVLASEGYTNYYFDQDITYHDDLAISAKRLNQFNILFERNLDRTVSAQQTAQVIVNGVVNSGGAQADLYNTENNPNVSDIFSWTLSTRVPQQLKFGIQLPNIGRRILEDGTNRQGTYVFASAAAYAAGMPSSFSIQQGQQRFQTLFAQPSAFFLDQIQVTSRLTVIPGLRYDFQNILSNTKDGLEPHLSLAYVLDKDHGVVVRTGAAAYIRRVGVNIGQQLARYEHAAERSLLVTTNLCYPVITACNPLAAQPPSLYQYAPGLQAPVQGYFGMSVEGEVTKHSTLTLGYDGFRGWHALRSIDVNAPLPPFTSAARPNPAYAQIAQLNSGGYQKTDGMSLSYRGRLRDVFSGFLQYTLQHADADTQFSTFFPQNQYLPNAEWSRSDYDQRQKLSFFGTVYPDKPVTLGVGFYASTPLPYTITTGTDPYFTGLFNERPAGVARNSVNGGDSQDLQLKLAYTRKLHPKLKDDQGALSLSISSFNTFNRANYTSYDGVVGSALFRQPTTANSPRRLQLAASYSF